MGSLYPYIQGLSKANQKAIVTRVKRISKAVESLNDSFIVEKAIFNMEVKNNYKNKLFEAYQYFCSANGIEYKKPKKLKVEQYPIVVPVEVNIDRIIACCGHTYSVVFLLSKYGLRPDEISKLKLRNFNFTNQKLTVPTSKLGNNRTLTLKNNVIEIVRNYILKRGMIDPDTKLFGASRKVKAAWVKYRKRAYEKFNDPELLKIRLYDLRHWFGTTKYLETHDIYFVSYLLGHKNLQNTLIYIHLSRAFEDYDTNFVCKIATKLEEATALIEAGFSFVCDMEGVKLFRKAK